MQVLQPDRKGKDYLYLGYPLHLTPKEFDILHALCEQGSYDAGETAASASVHVCAINKKAQAIGGRRLVCTVRGRGYQFCDDI